MTPEIHIFPQECLERSIDAQLKLRLDFATLGSHVSVAHIDYCIQQLYFFLSSAQFLFIKKEK